jgi:hypothetical protein
MPGGSEVRQVFEAQALAKNWDSAVPHCNGLNMYEMLRGMASIPASILKEMLGKLDNYACHRARIRWAADVVLNRRMPAGTPPVPPDQVQEARSFLASPPGWDALHKYKHPGNQKVRLSAFWASTVSTDPSTRYFEVAEKMLKEHGLGLDIAPGRVKMASNTLAYGEQIYLESQADDLRKLAEGAGAVEGNRLIVIFVPFKSAVGNETDVNGLVRRDMPGFKPFVLINTNHMSADGVTLLHEIGHAADCEHIAASSGDVVQNFMSYGGNRSDMLRDQVIKISKSFFAK